MIILIGSVLLGIVALIWLWKVPVKKMINAMIESGSSVVEAYTVLVLLTAGLAFAVYMIAKVL